MQPLAHDGEAVRVTKDTDDCGCVPMGLLRGAEVWGIRQHLFDRCEGGTGWRVRGVDVGQCFGDSLAQPKWSFVSRLRFDECVQKLMREERFESAIVFENGDGLERDLVATSDCEEITWARCELAE